MHATLTPAYGRDYKSKAQIEADLLARKDFVLQAYNGGGYVNIDDFEDMRVDEVNVRYSNLRKVAVFRVQALLRAAQKGTPE